MTTAARQLPFYVETNRQLPLELRPLRAPLCIVQDCDEPVVAEMVNSVPAPVCEFHRDALKAARWTVKV